MAQYQFSGAGGHSQAGDALNSIRDAIGFYMQLKDQRVKDELAQQAAARQERALGIDEAQLGLAKQTSAQNQAKYIAGNYGGETFDPARPEQKTLLDQLTAGGLGGATSPETVPLSPVQQVREPGVPPYYNPSPVETGRVQIRQTDPYQLRQATMNNARIQSEGGLNRNNALAISGMRSADTMRRVQAQQAIAGQAQALQRYGIDVSSADRQSALANLIATTSALMNDKEFDNRIQEMRANPLAILQFLQQGQNGAGQPVAAPHVPLPQLYGDKVPTPGANQPGAPRRYERVK